MNKTCIDLNKSTDTFGAYIKYKDLLIRAVDDIKLNIHRYDEINIGGELKALEALDSYVFERKYNLEDNIIDVIIVTLAKVSSCDIMVHYQGRDGGFDTHVYESGSSKG